MSVSDLKLVFHWSVQQERSKSAAMRVVDFFFFRGKACLSEWNAFRKKKKLVLFLKYCLCPTFFIVLPCLLVTVVWKRKKKKTLTSLSAQSSHQKAAKSYKSVWLLLPEAFTPQYLRRHEMAPMQNKNKKKVLWGLQTTCTSCFLGYDIIEKGQFFPCPSQIFYLISFCICMNYTLCVPHFCVELEKD